MKELIANLLQLSVDDNHILPPDIIITYVDKILQSILKNAPFMPSGIKYLLKIIEIEFENVIFN